MKTNVLIEWIKYGMNLLLEWICWMLDGNKERKLKFIPRLFNCFTSTYIFVFINHYISMLKVFLYNHFIIAGYSKNES